jgi:hypothetical protein
MNLLIFSVLTFLLPGLLGAQDTVSPAQQASFLLKALSFDRNLGKRAAGAIRIGLIFRGEEQASSPIAAAFTRAGQKKVKGLAVHTMAIPFVSVETLLQRVESDSINALYIQATAAQALTSILQVTRSKKNPLNERHQTTCRTGRCAGRLCGGRHHQTCHQSTSGQNRRARFPRPDHGHRDYG